MLSSPETVIDVNLIQQCMYCHEDQSCDISSISLTPAALTWQVFREGGMLKHDAPKSRGKHEILRSNHPFTTKHNILDKRNT
jgi:hypothetical protein